MPPTSRKFKVVEELQRRTRKDGSEFFRAAVIEEGKENVVELYCKLEYGTVVKTLQNIENGGVFAGAPFMDGNGCINCTKETMVMPKCAPFTVKDEAIQQFVQPAVVTHQEARTSPKKRRLSVEGIVRHVSVGARGLNTIKLEELLKQLFMDNEFTKALEKCEQKILTNQIQANEQKIEKQEGELMEMRIELEKKEAEESAEDL